MKLPVKLRVKQISIREVPAPPPPYFGLKKGIAEGRTTIISEYYAGGSGIILIEA